MAKLSIYHGINELNKIKFINVVKRSDTYTFRDKLKILMYSDIMAIGEIHDEVANEVNIKNIPLYSREGISQIVFKYAKAKKRGYNIAQLNIIIDILVRLKNEYVKMTDGVYKNYIYNILHWLNVYAECMSTDYDNIIVNGDVLSDKSVVFFDILVRLDKKVSIIFGNESFESVNNFENLYRSELKMCERLRNNPIDFEEVFKVPKKIEQVVKNSEAKSVTDVQPWKTEEIVCDIPDYKVILDTKSNLDEVDDVIYAVEENMIFTAIILGHRENRDESHNEIVKIRKKIGDTICDQIQAQFEYITNITNDEIKYVMNDFKKYSLAELKAMGDLEGKPNDKGMMEVRRTSYELSKKLKNKNLIDYFRYIIDKAYENNEAEIKTLYNTSIKVCAMCNRINDFVEKSNTLMYFKVRKELSFEEKLFFRILSLSSINFIFVDWFKYTFWNEMNNVESISIITHDYKVIDNTLNVPREFIKAKVSTMANRASKQVDNILYDCETLGMYKDNQFKNNNSIVLSTTFDEIELLWRAESKVRPNFDVNKDNGVVTIPTIFANISGIGGLDDYKYSEIIQRLCVSHTYVMCNRHFILNNQARDNIFSMYREIEYEGTYRVVLNSISFNGVTARNQIKQYWKYNILNDDKQDLMINKLDELCKNLKYMKDVELDDIAIAMSNLPDNIINDILWFDFTKMSPKIIMIMTSQDILNKYDCLTLAFCNLLGFDVAVFNPTGYKGLDGYLASNLYEQYNLGAPRLNVIFRDKKQNKGFFKSLFE